MENKIEKRIELKAPISRVWNALTDYRQFGEWFLVKLEGPFVPGQVTRGRVTYPGYEHVTWEAKVEKMDHHKFFSFTWPHARSFDKANYSTDYTHASRTLVEFRLEEIPAGTRLVLTESGFERLPEDFRLEAFRRNDGGWTEQMKNIEAYVAQAH